MTTLKAICAASVLMLGFAVAASAADRPVAKSTLGSMGLSSMKALSGSEGATVRGQGTSASVYGASAAHLPGQSATAGYNAAASHNHSPSTAGGAGISVVGAAVGNHFIIVGAAGASIAKAR